MNLNPTAAQPVYCNAREHWPVIEVVINGGQRGWRGLREDGVSEIVPSASHLPNAPLLCGDPELEATWLVEHALFEDPVERLAHDGSFSVCAYDFVPGTPDLTVNEFHIAPVSASRLVLSVWRSTVYALDADGRGADTDTNRLYARVETPSAVAASLIEIQRQLTTCSATETYKRVMPDLDALAGMGHLALTKALHAFARNHAPDTATPELAHG